MYKPCNDYPFTLVVRKMWPSTIILHFSFTLRSLFSNVKKLSRFFNTLQSQKVFAQCLRHLKDMNFPREDLIFSTHWICDVGFLILLVICLFFGCLIYCYVFFQKVNCSAMVYQRPSPCFSRPSYCFPWFSRLTCAHLLPVSLLWNQLSVIRLDW